MSHIGYHYLAVSVKKIVVIIITVPISIRLSLPPRPQQQRIHLGRQILYTTTARFTFPPPPELDDHLLRMPRRH